MPPLRTPAFLILAAAWTLGSGDASAAPPPGVQEPPAVELVGEPPEDCLPER